MSRPLTAAETEALLSDLVRRQNCTGGCQCVFCRTFEEGVACGKQDAAIEFQRALDKLKRGLSA